MTTDEYQEKYYCNCPKCGELPKYKRNEKGQWAVCEPCGLRWLIGKKVLEDCQEGDMRKLTQVLVA